MGDLIWLPTPRVVKAGSQSTISNQSSRHVCLYTESGRAGHTLNRHVVGSVTVNSEPTPISLCTDTVP